MNFQIEHASQKRTDNISNYIQYLKMATDQFCSLQHLQEDADQQAENERIKQLSSPALMRSPESEKDGNSHDRINPGMDHLVRILKMPPLIF